MSLKALEMQVALPRTYDAGSFKNNRIKNISKCTPSLLKKPVRRKKESEQRLLRGKGTVKLLPRKKG